MSQFVDLSAIKADTNTKDMSIDGGLDEREILRAIRQGIAAEHEAVHLYELIADSTNNSHVKEVMQDVANEEKVHAHEFQKLLDILDPDEEESKEEAEEEFNELVGDKDSVEGEVTEDVEVKIKDNKFLVESGDYIIITESAVKRKYLEVDDGNEIRYFSAASANDNYMVYFIDRLCRSRRFDCKYKTKIVRKIPSGSKKMSLETFVKELIPIPVKRK